MSRAAGAHSPAAILEDVRSSAGAGEKDAMKLCIHRYHEVKNTGLHSYQQCRCGKRKIIQTSYWGHQPVCRSWVETGEFMKPPVPSSLVKPSDAAPSAKPPIKPPISIRSYDW